MPMFKFTIRDLLWLTLVVAVGLGWFVRERQMYTRLTQTELAAETERQALTDRAAKWRRRTGALESFVTHQCDRVVLWGPSSVVLERPGRDRHTEHTGVTDGAEPSIQDD